MIYSDGTTNLVSGSAIVRGTGTQWKSNINGIAAGQIISIQSGNTVIQNVIRSVNSDTELVLAFAPSVNLNNANYVISTTVPDTVSDGVRHMVAINAYIIQFLQNMDRWMSENGKVEVEMPNGQKVTLDSIRALQAGVEGKLVKEQNGADIPNKPEFVKNLGLGESAYVQFLQVTTKSLIIRSDSPWGGVSVYRPSGTYWRIEGNPDDASALLNFIDREANSSNRSVQTLPKGNGTLLSLGTNCWRDGNGFIKQGSPIIQIYPEGQFETNDESEGATVTKLGLGHYKLSGILGYNSDGAWGVHGGISVPRDVNGNELVYVDDKVLPDGAIEIRVTHRQNAHMPARLQNRRMKSVDESTHYTDDEPCDLPAGTRLDVRVQMPEDSIWNLRQHKSADTAPDIQWTEHRSKDRGG
ncbi:hypothetical protein [Xenorhabdus bovienii]|uniref:phage tail fiber protein n=1 Tax=Xenorhabdus bovienii TaxID=40576 RepID=UPI0023B28725|nr:hypothetical protein [Xenorhabdus bovienii]MDE9480992.1 hypothetical protein [Xenorhabdus bovienii]